MNYLSCPLKYIDKRGRTFHTRYKEHVQPIRNNNSNLGYSSHILNTGHTYGTIIDTKDIRKIPNTHKISKNNLNMNYTNTDTHNSIEKSSDFIGNRTHDLPACSIIPQPTTLPRAHNKIVKVFLNFKNCLNSFFITT
jgi:hypothetical protein